jgi:hypothetical protein
LDGSYLIGQDTLADPFLRGVAQQTLSTNDTINIDGPFAVQVCHTNLLLHPIKKRCQRDNTYYCNKN